MSKRSASDLSEEQQQTKSKQRREEATEATNNTKTNTNSNINIISSMSGRGKGGGSHVSSNESSVLTTMTPAASDPAPAASSSSSSSSNMTACGIEIWCVSPLRREMVQLFTKVLASLATAATTPASNFSSAAGATSSVSSPLMSLSVAAAIDSASHVQRHQQKQQQVNSSIQTLCKRVIDIVPDCGNWVEEMIRAGGIHALSLIANKSTLTTVEVAPSEQQRIAAQTLLERHFPYSIFKSISRRFFSGQLESVLESFLIRDLTSIVLEYQSLTAEEEIILANGRSEVDRFEINFDDENDEIADGEDGKDQSSVFDLNQLMQDLNSSTYDPASPQLLTTLTLLNTFVSRSLANRDAAIDAGIISPLSLMMSEWMVKATSSLRPLFVLLTSLTRPSVSVGGEPSSRSVDVFDFIILLPLLSRGLWIQDEETLISIFKIFEQLSSLSLGIGQVNFPFFVRESGRRFVELLMHRAPLVKIGALKVILNLTRTASESHRAVFLNVNIFACLMSLFVSPKKVIRRDAILLVARLIRDSQEHIEQAINGCLVPPLIHVLSHEEADLQKCAVLFFYRALSCGTYQQVRYMVNNGVIAPLCPLLNAADEKLVLMCLFTLESILRVGKEDAQGINIYASQIEESGGLDFIESLQLHVSKEICASSVRILQTYFVNEDDEQEEYTQPVSRPLPML